MAPWDVSGILSKCSDAAEVWITERGVLYGYNNLVVDFSGMDYMINNFKKLYKNVGYPKVLSYKLDKLLDKQLLELQV